MAKDNSRNFQLRQRIAQLAARMMADEGITDYSHAKRKAGRQLGITEDHCMPTNVEIVRKSGSFMKSIVAKNNLRP